MEKSQIGNEISFLAIFSNFFYYLMFVPFKTVLDPETNHYRLQTHPVQKMFCLFGNIGVVAFTTYLLICGLLLKQQLEPSIVDAFDFVANFSICISTVLMIFILWRRRMKYLEVIESTRITLRRARRIKILFHLYISVITGAWSTISWLRVHDDLHYANLHTLHRYLLGGNRSSNDLSDLHVSQNILQNVFYLGLSIICVYASLFYITNHGIFLMLVFSVRQLGKVLRTELTTEGNKSVEVQRGYELWRKMKSKVDLIKCLFGYKIMVYYIISVCYYAKTPHIMFGNQGNIEKVTLAYFLLASLIWIMAAEFHKEVQETVLKWIAYHSGNENLKSKDMLKLLALSNEMSADPIALSSRYFYVTYQQLSAMLGLVVTYGIIVFQVQNGQTFKETS
ncbi:unnamed protein product [Orchesella dallaii]|uniref:Gustatory receptor n=1 Tax=Orchesella dallaii TaxID=48710 RepID=A0ABP1QGK2_9HEXA